MMDANILLPPTMTPLTGIEFNKRLPCGEVERARRVREQIHKTVHVQGLTFVRGTCLVTTCHSQISTNTC